ncbi:MAG: c-type cytochrome [Verrucomicrobia bacterium]|nr:c-type cytochrome [Verrucomicrobiota bacterium]
MRFTTKDTKNTKSSEFLFLTLRVFRVLRGEIFLLFALAAAGCRQDMYNQPRYKPLSASEFFEDGTSARPLPEHVIPRGQLREDDLLNQGKTADGKLATAIPIPVTRELLARGQDRFNIFCSVCHGYTGQGNGMIVMRGFPPPNSYHSDRLRNAPPGYFFDIITNGYGVMYPYSYRIPDVNDRWAVVAYIRALQLSRHATPDDVPADERAKLEAASPSPP